jgi:hypothetical protein
MSEWAIQETTDNMDSRLRGNDGGRNENDGEGLCSPYCPIREISVERGGTRVKRFFVSEARRAELKNLTEERRSETPGDCSGASFWYFLREKVLRGISKLKEWIPAGVYPCGGGDQMTEEEWIPAFAGMTEGEAGMTELARGESPGNWQWKFIKMTPNIRQRYQCHNMSLPIAPLEKGQGGRYGGGGGLRKTLAFLTCFVISFNVYFIRHIEPDMCIRFRLFSYM